MKLCTFVPPGRKRTGGRLGVVVGDRVFEVTFRGGMEEFISSGKKANSLRKGRSYPLAKAILLVPLARPGKIVAAIVNTQAMLGGDDVRLDRPRLDMKAPSAVIGPGEVIRAPASGFRPEVELAVVVGRRISRAAPPRAKEAIFGYTVLNDVTSPPDSREDAYEAYRRDAQTGQVTRRIMRGPLFRSKNHDTFCPMGPWIVTADELRDVSRLLMTSKFDGRVVQRGSTSDYLFRPEVIASYVSGFLTLEPGDIVSCGSVGWVGGEEGGDPAEFILPSKNGTLELEIEGIGVLKNIVKTEGSRS